MRVRSLLAVTLAVVLASSWLSIAFYPSVLDFMGSNPGWNGISQFGRSFAVESLTSLDQLNTGAEADVLIVIPDTPYHDDELGEIAGFVAGGGTLLVLDDYGYGNQVLETLGLDMRFAGAALLDPYLNYRNPRLPVITDLAPGLKDAGVSTLVLNHATALFLPPEDSPDTPGYEILARSSDMSFLDINGNGVRDEGEPGGPLAAAARIKSGSGTVVAVGDPSILINGMTGRGDNGKFVEQLVSSALPSPGAGRIVLDTSHLRKAPLDTAKDAWAAVRDRLASPYALALIAGAIVMLSFTPVWRKGAEIER